MNRKKKKQKRKNKTKLTKKKLKKLDSLYWQIAKHLTKTAKPKTKPCGWDKNCESCYYYGVCLW